MSKEWKLVPVEPTDDMKEAGAPSCEYTGTVCAALCYEAMLAAAPVVEIKPAGWLYTEHSENGHPYKPDFSQSQWVSMPDTYQEQPVYLAPPELAELKAVVEQQKSLIASLRAELTESYSITDDTLRSELETLRQQHAEQSCVFCNDSGELLTEVKTLCAQLESTKAALREEMKDAFEFQQKNSALIELLRETSDYLDGSTRNSVWCDSILHKKMKAAIQPAESGESA